MLRKNMTDIYSLTLGACVLGCGMVLGWIFSKKEKFKPRSHISSSREESFSDFGHVDLKLVLVVNNSLKMGKGKIAAQCSHASVLAYRQAQRDDPHILQKWERSGQRKVVVKADDEKVLYELIHAAEQMGLITSLISDAGRTQIPSGSKTVVGIGPGPEQLIDAVTGHLKLL